MDTCEVNSSFKDQKIYCTTTYVECGRSSNMDIIADVSISKSLDL